MILDVLSSKSKKYKVARKFKASKVYNTTTANASPADKSNSTTAVNIAFTYAASATNYANLYLHYVHCMSTKYCLSLNICM